MWVLKYVNWDTAKNILSWVKTTDLLVSDSNHPHPGRRRGHRALYPSHTDTGAPQTCRWQSSGARHLPTQHWTEAGTSLPPVHGLSQHRMSGPQKENGKCWGKNRKRARPKKPPHALTVLSVIWCLVSGQRLPGFCRRPWQPGSSAPSIDTFSKIALPSLWIKWQERKE